MTLTTRRVEMMRNIIDYAANFVVFVLGMFHTVSTLLTYRPFDLNALMHTGAGLAFIFVTIFNIARIKSTERFTKLLCLVCNIITFLYVLLIAIVFADLRPYIVSFAFIILVYLSAVDYKHTYFKHN